MKDLSLHILDVARNSVEANATNVKVDIQINEKTLTLSINDNGKGMSDEMCESVVDPFVTSRTTRKVGLGIPLLKHNCELTGGEIKITSKLGKGTTTTAIFNHDSIDMIPVGNIGEAFVILITSDESILFTLQHNNYSITSAEISEAIDGMSLSNPNIFKAVVELINGNLIPN